MDFFLYFCILKISAQNMMTLHSVDNRKSVRWQLGRMAWHFDRVFGDNSRFGWQVTFIVLLVVVLVAFVAMVGWLLTWVGMSRGSEGSAMVESIELVLGTGDMSDGSHFPRGWQTIVTLLSAVIYSGVTITFVSNLLGNRQKAFRKGTVRYRFEGHVLFLGGNHIILPMLKEMVSPQHDVVILTAGDVGDVRTMVERYLPADVRRRCPITVLGGDHYDRDTLKSIFVNRASKIYIVGDHMTDSEHDSQNMACWNLVRELCNGRKWVPCNLFFSRESSAQLFRRRQREEGCELDTNVINRFEAVAQRVLVHNGKDFNRIPALDREGIGFNDRRTVHLVLGGMTDISCAMAVTAAHLCHFPNDVDPVTCGGVEGRRTRITFVQSGIERDMQRFMARKRPLFELSHVAFIHDGEVRRMAPKAELGDFLDVEWEFVDGGTSEPWVMELMRGYYEAYRRGETYLTMAFCDPMADRNIAAAIYLPTEYHNIVKDSDGRVDYHQTVPLLLYQPENGELVRSAQRGTHLYANMFAFGSAAESYDPSIRRRIAEGKRVNYLYHHKDDFTAMPGQEELDRLWRELSYSERMSNIYNSNQIGVKQRSMARSAEQGVVGEELMCIMSMVEHNRWTMERLLQNYEAIPSDRREALLHLEGEALEAEMTKMRRLKKVEYKHYCIAPFIQLSEVDKEYDRLIVDHLDDIVKN